MTKEQKMALMKNRLFTIDFLLLNQMEKILKVLEW